MEQRQIKSAFYRKGENMKNRLTQAVIVASVASALVATPVFAEPTVDDLKKNKAAAESEVGSLQEELTQLVSKISQLESDLIEKGEEITKAEDDLKEAQKQEEEQYEDMKLRIKFMYEEGDTSFVETLVSAKNFSDLVNKAEYVQNVHTYDRQMLTAYVETKQKVADLKDTLEEEMTSMENMQQQFESDKDSLDATLESKQAEIANLDGEIQAAVEKAAEERRKEEEARQQQARQPETAQTPSGDAGTGGAGGGVNKPSTSLPSYQGQGDTAVAQAIVSAAYSQLGVPYKWGGTTPGVGLDCSGLVQYAHRVAGISIPRNSEAQYAAGKKVSNPQPGDIAWKPGHVGVYIGNGKMIEAQQTGTNIMVSNVRAVGYARYW